MFLLCKWGCDGTSGQSTFKQKFSNDNGKVTDSSIFYTSLVLLQLHLIMNETNEKKIVWQNPRPSSSKYCRPIKIEFLHETAESMRSEIENIKEQEKKLVSYQYIIDGINIPIKYKLSLTMIDGKICNSLTNTASSLRCYICLATSKEFKDIDKMLESKIHEENLQYGISSLHAWIRCFESYIHVSYKLGIKKWQARNDSEKENVKQRKKKHSSWFQNRSGIDD